ncbi:MAG: DUF2490 domain-containing protein, partial [Flammeovirgaceae bacterium]|nr:DUF2490 domain-containing protein [Flammeovirgaceae bacterium]MDW8288035.1 DUF2490 domain-containing protein [Flammeovirgaceae bacterium]
MTKVYVLGVLLFFCSSPPIDAQNNRLSTHESIGWYNYFGTIYLSSKVGLHTEYQWRRVRIIADAQQNLLRTGINYRVTPNILARIGYAWIETFAYGEIPINALGRTFTEHRFFQMIQLNHKESIVVFSHRFILEQRFVGRYSTAVALKEDE